MTAGNIRNRYAGLGCFLHHRKLLIRRVLTAALDPSENFYSINTVRHGRTTRKRLCPVQIGVAPGVDDSGTCARQARRVRARMHFLQLQDRDARIDLGGREIRVTQEGLDVTDIRAVLQHVSRARVAQEAGRPWSLAAPAGFPVTRTLFKISHLLARLVKVQFDCSAHRPWSTLNG